MTFTRTLIIWLPLALGTLLFWLSKSEQKEVVWIYASTYKEVIRELDLELKKTHPEIEVRWYQSGSENVAARLNAELAAGKPRADLIMTSDPFWYLELKKAGHLYPYQDASVGDLPSHYQDPEGAFRISRIPVMVLAYRKTEIAPEEAPQTWEDLLLPKWKHKISMPSPLESGTSLTFSAQMVKLKGWSFFEKLKKNQLLVAGGNSAVLQRIETGERPIGIVLLENALQAKSRGVPLEVIYPKEGVVLIPSPMAILSSTPHLALSKTVYDFFFTRPAQQIFLDTFVYSPVFRNLAPPGAKPLIDIENTQFGWSPQTLETLAAGKSNLKTSFSELMLK